MPIPQHTYFDIICDFDDDMPKRKMGGEHDKWKCHSLFFNKCHSFNDTKMSYLPSICCANLTKEYESCKRKYPQSETTSFN